MSRLLFLVMISLGLFQHVQGQGYVQEKHTAGINLAITNYHLEILDNRENTTNYLSFATSINYNRAISPLFNFNQMLQYGNLQNASTNEDFWTKSPFLSYNLGLSLNVLKFFDRKFDAPLIVYANTGYGFQYLWQTSATKPNPIISNFKVGAGVSYLINKEIAIYAQYNILQRLGNDFKTGFETQFGCLVPLSKLLPN